MLLAGRAQRFDERLIEYVHQRLADRVVPLDSVEILERMIPADDALLHVEDDEPVVERFEDVLVELAHPPELFRLQVQLAVQAAVLDRRRDLARDRRQQREVLAVERLVGLLAAEREHGDGAALEDARHEVVHPRVAPELHLLGDEPRGRRRIVDERHRMTGVEARHHRRAARQPRHGAWKSVIADRLELPRRVGRRGRQHQRHPIDEERFDDARDETPAQTDDVQVAVQIAGERDERAAVVVAVAIEHAVERVLHRFLHRLRQQHHHHRREQRDDAGVLVGGVAEQKSRRAPHRHVQDDTGRKECRVREAALDDDFHVAQPITDDRGRERQRHEAERDGGQLQRGRRIEAERPRECVGKRERAGAERRPPGDPPQLTPRRCRRDLLEGAGEHEDRGGGAPKEIRVLEAIERVERARKRRAVRRGASERHNAHRRDGKSRSVRRRNDQVGERSAGRGGTLREHEGEMQQQRRQQRERDRVAPVEDAIERVERTGKREREDAEERDADPEEVQRRLIARAPQAHGAADEQREQPDGSEHVIHRARARRRRQRDIERLPRSETKQRVGESRAFVAAVLICDNVSRRLDGRTVDGEQHIAPLDAGRVGRRSGSDLLGADAFGAIVPEHAVFDVVPARIHRDVRDAESNQDEDDDRGKRRPAPDEPGALG